MAPLKDVESLKQTLLKLGHSDFVIISPDGSAAETCGAFVDNGAKCRAAYSVVQQATSLLRQGEKLKRVTVKFAEYTFVASVCQIANRTFGVVVQQASAPPSRGAATAPGSVM